MDILKIKRLSQSIPLPRRGTEESAGLDLSADIEAPLTLKPGELIKIPTGIAVELPAGTGGFVFARSSLGARGVTLANSVGVIDRDYRGEIKLALVNLSSEQVTIAPNERIAQLVVLPVVLPKIVETNRLDKSERGEGGFGSTGTAP